MKPIKTRLLRIAVVLVTVLAANAVSTSVFADCQTNTDQGGGQGNQRQARREPPPQAYEDCKGKKVGDVVQITTPHDEKISATCTDSPKGLFARPAHPPRDQGNESGQKN
jgi:hypothetical protein